MSTDINIDKITTDGPKLLRSYIDFAMNGISVLGNAITQRDIIEHDSPFEKSVYDFLEHKGYQIGTQIGCSGYKIDMAVKHPTLSGQYILGIECDGASYHSARTARERDRLRQDVLENMGWKIYRVWSTDWIKDQVTEGEHLIEAIEDALSSYSGSEAIEYEIEVASEVESEMEDFVTIDKKEISLEDIVNPYGFAEIQEIDFSQRSDSEKQALSLNDCILEVVNKSFPIHYDLICKELAPFLGNQKATVKVKREVDIGLNSLKNELIRKDDFFFPTNYSKVLVHIPNTRKINYIAVEELAEAMYVISTKLTGATRESLCSDTTRAFGFKRMTQNISDSMSQGFELLLKQNLIGIIDGKVIIKK